MADRKIEWGITANSAEFDLAMAQMQKSIQTVGAMFRGQMQQMSDEAKKPVGMIGELKKSIAELAENARSGNLNGFVETVGNFKTGALLAVGAVVELVKKVGEAAHATYELNDAAEDLAAKLGISATAAGLLSTRTQLADLDTQVYTSALQALNKQLKSNEDALQAMGLQTRDSNGNLRSSTELMDEVVRVLGEYKAGTDRQQAALVLLGKGAGDADQLLKMLNVTQAEARDFSDTMGLTLTKQSQAMSGEYENALHQAGLSLKGLSNAVGTAVMPAFTDMMQMFTTVAPSAIVVLRGAVGGLASGFYLLETGIRTVWETFNATLYNIVEPIRALFEATGKVMVGDFSGAASALRASAQNVEDVWTGAMDRIGKSAQDTRDKMAYIFAPGDAAEADTGGGKTYQGEGDTSAAKQRAQETLTTLQQGLDQQLAAKKLYGEQAKAFEREYWAQMLTFWQRGTAEHLAIQKKLYDAENALNQKAVENAKKTAAQKAAAVMDGFAAQVADAGKNYDAILQIERQALAQAKQLYGQESAEYRRAAAAILDTERKKQEQLRALKQQQVDQGKTLALEQLGFDEQMAQLQQQAGEITQNQLLRMQKEFEQRRYEIEAQALEQRKGLVDETKDPERYQQLLLQIELLERQHNNRMRLIDKQISTANTPFTRMVDGIKTTWTSGLQSMMRGTLGFRDALRGAYSSIISGFQKMVAEKVMNWVFGEENQTAATMLGTAQRTAIEAGAAMKSVALWAWAAVKNIMANAWQAMAAAWQAMVGIPYVGPIIAPIVAAVTFAGVAALAGKVASASGGYDIPAGVNPLVQAHAEEMILPADIAKPLRAGLKDGQGVSAGDSYHFTVKAMDSRDVRRFFDQHAPTLVQALKRQARMNVTPE